MVFRIDGALAVNSLPTPESIGPKPNGYFFDGDPASGVLGTKLSAAFLNAVQESLGQFIEGQSVALAKNDYTTLAKAILYAVQKATSAYAVASGTNTYTASLTPALLSYTTGAIYKIYFANTNTTTSTLNINSVGAKNIVLNTGASLLAGQLPSNALLLYDGTSLVLLNPSNQYQIVRYAQVNFSGTGTQALTANTLTKIQFNNTLADTNSFWDAVNYRFNLSLAGKYRVSSIVHVATMTSTTNVLINLIKNGTFLRRFGEITYDSSWLGSSSASCIVTSNGSDNIYLAGFTGGSGGVIGQDANAGSVTTNSDTNLFEIEYLGL